MKKKNIVPTVRGHDKVLPKAESALPIVIVIAVLILCGTGCCAIIYCIKKKNRKKLGKKDKYWVDMATLEARLEQNKGES